MGCSRHRIRGGSDLCRTRIPQPTWLGATTRTPSAVDSQSNRSFHQMEARSRIPLCSALFSLATVTGLYFWLDVPLVAAAFTYLVVLVLLSLVSNLSSLIVLSFIGVGCLSYFFAPPIYSFRVDYPQDLITISAFVITSFVVNFLVTRVRAEQRDHAWRREELSESETKIQRLVNTTSDRVFGAQARRASFAGKRSEVPRLR